MSWRQTDSSITGGTEANVPTGPESMPTATRLRTADRRSRFRFISANQSANFMPKLIGSACIPCERPMHGVFLCSIALVRNALRSSTSPRSNRSHDCASCILSAVSLTSLEVSPWCTHRLSGPRLSPTARVNETRSCLVSSNHLSYEARSNLAFRIFAMSSSGTTPSSVHACEAAISTCSHNS